MEKLLYSSKTVMYVLDIDKNVLTYFNKMNLLHPTKINSKNYYYPDDVKALLELIKGKDIKTKNGA